MMPSHNQFLFHLTCSNTSTRIYNKFEIITAFFSSDFTSRAVQVFTNFMYSFVLYYSIQTIYGMIRANLVLDIYDHYSIHD